MDTTSSVTPAARPGRRALRIVGIAVLAVIVLVALAAAVLAWRFDPAWAKQKLIDTVQAQKHRTLKIDGDLALSFYPSVGVKLGKASLSERESPQEFASVERAHVSMRVLPLLKREFVVDRLDLDGVRARIVRGKDGKFNFDDLLAKDAAPREPGGEAGAPAAFDIAGIAIERSAVSFRDEQAGRTIELSDVHVKTGRLAQAASGPLELAFRAASGEPKLDATVGLDGTYRYDLGQKQYAIEKLAMKVNGELLGVTQCDAVLRAGVAALGRTPGGVEVEALTLAAKGRLSGDALDATLDVPRIAVAGDRASGRDAKASVKLAGDQRLLDAKLVLAGIEGSSSRWRIGKVDAQWRLNRGPLAMSGQAAGALDADMKARAVDLPKLAGQLQLAHPSLPMKQVTLPLDAALHADWGTSQASGRVTTRFDESAVQGKFQVTRFSPLAAGFDVAIDRLDVDRYLPPDAAPARAAASGAPAAAAASPSPIDLSFLRGLDLQGSARIGAMQVRHLHLANVAAKLVARGGRLAVDPLTADLYGGRLAGSLSAQAEGNRIAVRQTLDDVAIGPLLRDYARKDLLEGRGRVVLDVATGGSTALAMRQSLGGTASLSLRDGALKGINLAKTLREAKSALGGGGQAVASDASQKTDFSELSASFRIANGVARNDDLAVKSPFLRGAGAGTIDLGREQIDYLAKVTVVATTKGQEGRELAELSGLTVPVRLSGPLEHPSWRVEVGALAAEFAKQQAQKKLGEQIGKQLGDKGLGDKGGLGGLLKGLMK